jgi:hypothetical protein
MGVGIAQIPADILRQLPPGAQAVDAVPDNGGWLILGSDGGVFALGGANLAHVGGDPNNPFSYTGLGNQDPNRKFASIEVNHTGGYDLLDVNNFRYSFDSVVPPPDTTVTTNSGTTAQVGTAGPSVAQTTSGQGLLNSILAPLGLSGLSSQATQWAIDSGNSSDYIIQKLRQTPEYQQAFPEVAARQKNGLPPVAEADILNYRASVKQILKSNGMDPNTFSSQEVSNFISNDVSPAELGDRIQKGYVAAMQAPPEFRQAMATLGVGAGDLTHFFLDPGAAYDSIMQKAAMGANALEQGYGTLTADEMAKLVGSGVSPDQAKQAFGQLYTQKQLLGNLPGQTDADISRDTQLQYAEGLAPAQQQLQHAAERRTAEFGGGGGVAGTSQGLTGAGSVP